MQLGRNGVGVTLFVMVAALFLSGAWPGTLAAQTASTERAMSLAQQAVKRNPFDARAYYRLGDAYIRKARDAGDVTYFDLAEQALRKALAIHPRYSEALRHLAFVLYSRHDFAGAAIEARKALALDPNDRHAEGILGDAWLEVGEYEQAAIAYQRMIDIGGDVYSYSRRAGLKNLQGDTQAALDDLDRAIHAGRVDRAPAESIAWAQWQLGSDHFALGDLDRAETQYAEALKTFPNYYRALAGLAAVRAAQQRYEDAIELYRKTLGIIPLPEYAAALGDIYTKRGRPDEARKQYDLVEYIGRLNALNNVLYNRELALFYADHDIKLPEALDLARRELEIRRDIYAWDVLAWALYKNGRLPEARTAMQEALKLGTRDARLFFHAGMIHLGLGEATTATTYLERALTTNPHFHVLHADLVERTLKGLKVSAVAECLEYP